MSKRNLIAEITEKNDRSRGRYLHGNLELYELESTFDRLTESDGVLRALHVVGLTSCVEAATREAIKQLVNSGDPFLQRAESFKDIRFDFALTQALSEGRITFGDLVSHSLSINQVGQIASNLSTLFGVTEERGGFKALLAGVKEYCEPSDEELFGDVTPGTSQQNAPLLLPDVDGLLRDMSRMFEVRHIIAHEANFGAVNQDDLASFMKACRAFLDALYELVQQTLHPGASRSGFGGSLQALTKAAEGGVKASECEARIESTLAILNPENGSLSKLFDESKTAFEAYYEAETSFRLELHKPLNGNAMRNIESDVMTHFFSHRLTYLRSVEEALELYAPGDR